MLNVIPISAPVVERISDESDDIIIDCLRLDKIHTLVSGNKWFKLQPYLEKCTAGTTIVTLGGAWSNHIVATAVAAKLTGLRSIGIIRGEEPDIYSDTLNETVRFGMNLRFLSRTDYRMRRLPEDVVMAIQAGDMILIDEGGRGPEGIRGAAHVLDSIHETYNYIMLPVGTGTTFGGIVSAAPASTQVLGVSALKNGEGLIHEISAMAPALSFTNARVLTDYHFGGYAKSTRELFNFMNHWFEKTAIPSDFVYTGKMFFALENLKQNNYFPAGSKILMIHTGGLQGNRSLPKGTLIF